MQFDPYVLINTKESWQNSTSQQMSERWRVFVWRSARCEPHTPEKQLGGHTWQSTYITCSMFCSFGNVSWENAFLIHSCLEFLLWKCLGHILVEWLNFILFVDCLLSGYISFLLWLSYILPHQWTCALQMISSGFPIYSALTVTGSSALVRLSKLNCPLHCLQVWHLHATLLSVYRRKSGLMSVFSQTQVQLWTWEWFLLRWSSAASCAERDTHTALRHTGYTNQQGL